jgi:hypothetical protein
MEIPLMHFLSQREADAIAAGNRVRVAVAHAKLVTPQMGGG